MADRIEEAKSRGLVEYDHDGYQRGDYRDPVIGTVESEKRRFLAAQAIRKLQSELETTSLTPKEILVIGSVAKNMANPESDIDILAIYPPGISREELKRIYEIMRRLKKSFGNGPYYLDLDVGFVDSKREEGYVRAGEIRSDIFNNGIRVADRDCGKMRI